MFDFIVSSITVFSFSLAFVHICRLDIINYQTVNVVVKAHFSQRRCKITTYFANYQTIPKNNYTIISPKFATNTSPHPTLIITPDFALIFTEQSPLHRNPPLHDRTTTTLPRPLLQNISKRNPVMTILHHTLLPFISYCSRRTVMIASATRHTSSFDHGTTTAHHYI